MSKNILEKLQNGENIYGTGIVSTSPVWPKALKNSGIDYVFIDTEHIPIDRNELASLCQVYLEMDIAPIVRVPAPDPYLAFMAKDAGAMGVVFPYVESAEQVRQLVGATKYRPLKGERLQRILNKEEVPEPELKDYLEKYNEGSLAIINVESLTAYKNLDELLSVDGLDAVVIGPHDLSINMGIPEQYDHPEFERVVGKIIKSARSKGIAAGIHFPDNPDRQIKWMKEGLNFVMYSSDLFLFIGKLKQDIAWIKKAAGDKDTASEDTGVDI